MRTNETEMKPVNIGRVKFVLCVYLTRLYTNEK